MTQTPVTPTDTATVHYSVSVRTELPERVGEIQIAYLGVDAVSAAHALIGVCEDLAEGDALGWTVVVRRDPNGPALARMSHDTWKSLPPGLTLDEKAAVGMLSPSEGQPDPEGSQGAGVTGASEDLDLKLEEKLRDLLGELLGVKVFFSEPIRATKVDVDLLRQLKLDVNPKANEARRYNEAAARWSAFSQYIAAAGSFKLLQESQTAHTMFMAILQEVLDAARDLGP